MCWGTWGGLRGAADTQTGPGRPPSNRRPRVQAGPAPHVGRARQSSGGCVVRRPSTRALPPGGGGARVPPRARTSSTTLHHLGALAPPSSPPSDPPGPGRAGWALKKSTVKTQTKDSRTPRAQTTKKKPVLCAIPCVCSRMATQQVVKRTVGFASDVQSEPAAVALPPQDAPPADLSTLEVNSPCVISHQATINIVRVCVPRRRRRGTCVCAALKNWKGRGISRPIRRGARGRTRARVVCVHTRWWCASVCGWLGFPPPSPKNPSPLPR